MESFMSCITGIKSGSPWDNSKGRRTDWSIRKFLIMRSSDYITIREEKNIARLLMTQGNRFGGD